jgi:hypothetical protein
MDIPRSGETLATTRAAGFAFALGFAAGFAFAFAAGFAFAFAAGFAFAFVRCFVVMLRG